MTSTILAQILSMMTLLVAPSVADGPGAHGHHGKGAGFCERLECTDDQRTQIEAIRAEHRSDSADERAQLKQLHAALKAEHRAAEPDAQKIASLRAELDAVKTTLRQARSESKAEVAAVLTPAQQERLAAMKAEHEARGKGKHGKDRKDHKDGAKGKRGAKGEKNAKPERGPEGKASAQERRGPSGKSSAKRERGAKGKAMAKRERGGKRAFAAG